jgi:hypothetical protein
VTTVETVLEQIRDNDPEIATGQIWKIIKRTNDYAFPDSVRVVCRYPFAEPEDGRLWIVEDDTAVSKLLRCPELTLRSLYKLET